MLKILLIVAVAIAAAFYFPRTRAVVLDVAAPVLNPMFSMATGAEMDKIAREVQTYERASGRLPDPREFESWLGGRYTGDAIRDSWGNVYVLVVRRDEFDILSFGPDGIRGTDDDITETAGRR